MSTLHGFTLAAEREIGEIRSRARLWKHPATGAELLSLCNADENKVFGVSFRTPSFDATGVAHILEHSVLCGSKKYPLKEPFVELIKGSLHSFVNAFTYPDRTCYPVASTHRKDFYNLIDVYLDAVFHPLLPEHVFRQEGWRVEPDPQAPDRLLFKGVVYNEMKGVYASPDDILSQRVLESLFPDTPYGRDSGGDPAHIPDLSWERFLDFHRQCYHPSNALFFFHGDDPEEARLARIAAELEGFRALAVATQISPQPAFSAPRRLVQPCPATEAELSARGMFTLNWLLPDPLDPLRVLVFNMLDHILLGTPASPLRKALIDSGMGEDIAGVGLENELRQMYFSTGLKGIDIADADRIETLIMDTLARLAGQGIDPELVEAAVNSCEFALRENNTGSFPRGLHLMLRALTNWLYGGDPFASLAFEAPLNDIKQRLAAGEPVFEAAIRAHFLDNPHRTSLLLEPDSGLLERQAAAEEARLEDIRASLGPEGFDKLGTEAEELQRLQSLPDPPEALRALPRLRLDELDRQNRHIPCEEQSIGKSTLLTHPLETDGIAYVDLAFDLAPVLATRPELVQLLPLFGRALFEMDTRLRSYVNTAMRIARKTGGVAAAPMAAPVLGQATPAVRLLLRGKSTQDKLAELLDIMREALLDSVFSDRDRFRQILLEEKAAMEERLVPGGHSLVMSRVLARFTQAGRVNEICGGVSQLFFLRKLEKALAADWEAVRQALEDLRALIVARAGLVANLTIDPQAMDGASRALTGLLEGLPAAVRIPASPPPAAPFAQDFWPTTTLPDYEGLTIPAQVNYVAKGADLFRLGYAYHGSAEVIAKSLRTGWLWERVRVQGGAYGAFCRLDRLSGTLVFASYRDPAISRTLDIFDASASHLRSALPGREDVERAIIGTISDIDAHLLPDAKGFVSLLRWLTGNGDEERQRVREEVLGTRAEDFERFAAVLELAAREGKVTVLGSRTALDDAAFANWTKTAVL